MKTFITALIVGAMALAPAACGSKKADEKKQVAAPAKKPEGKPLLMGEKPAGAKKATEAEAPKSGGAPATPKAIAPVQASTIPLEDSTPEGAVKTYVTRLAAGDLHGAAAVCVEESPGTVALQRTADGFDHAAADGIDPKSLAGFIVGHLKGATWEKGDETPDKVLFKVVPKGKEGVNIEAIRVGDVWRVTPPPTGIPT